MSTPENPANMGPVAPAKKRRLWLAVMIAIIMFFVGSGIGSAAAGRGQLTAEAPRSTVTTTVWQRATSNPAPTVTVTEELGESEEAVEQEPEETASEMTAGQEQALRRGLSGLLNLGTSRPSERARSTWNTPHSVSPNWPSNWSTRDSPRSRPSTEPASPMRRSNREPGRGSGYLATILGGWCGFLIGRRQ